MERGQSAYALLEKLDYVRVAGTEGEIRAAKVLQDAITDIGLTPRLETFEIDGYDVKTAKLKTISPECEYTVTGYGMSGSTDPEGIRAPFLYVEDGDDISLSQATRKIILLNGVVTPDKYNDIVKSGALGFIAISGAPIDEPEKTDLEQRMLRTERHLKNGQLPKIPGVTIRAVDALKLIKSEPKEIVLTLEQDEFKLKSSNVIAEIYCPGNEWVTFGAHYDSVPFSHGMYDNASGSAIIMEACRYFAKNKPNRPLRFIWFGAEERGLLGSVYHVANNAEEIKDTKLMLNVDLAGHVIGGHKAIVTGDKSFCGVLRFMAQEKGFGLSVKQDVFSSDSSPYADAGVPAISFYRAGTGGHNRYDILELVSPRSLDDTIDFLLYFSGKIINSAIFPVPSEIPDNMKERLDVYFGRKPKPES